MPAEKSPAFQFYPKDFLSSDAVSLMTSEQIGAYVLLLCHAWNNPEGLPSAPALLARLARTGTQRFERTVWPMVAGQFYQGDEGRWFNDRLEQERAKQAEFRESASRAGKRSAEQRAFNVRSTTVERPCNGNPTLHLLSASAVQEPPVPPSDEGGRRITRAELKSAEAVRRNARSGCWHEPKCENYATCVRLIALESRARVSV